MQCWSDDDKPGTKILLKGRSALSDAELISILIGNNGSRSALESARMLIHHVNDSLFDISRLSASDLVGIGSITLAQATRIITAFELGRRRMNAGGETSKRICSSLDAFNHLQAVLSDKMYEEFWVLLLNRGNRVVGKKLISEGGISGTVVDPKKVFKMALDQHASGIILGHNHPSGSLIPSEADIRITKKLSEAGAVLEISILDHIVVGEKGYYSFADQGVL